jgi:hypothetical protein
MFENNLGYIRNVVKSSLRKMRIDYRGLEMSVEKFPVDNEMYRVMVKGMTDERRVSLCLDIVVAPLQDPRFDVRAMGFVGDEVYEERKFSLTRFGVNIEMNKGLLSD